MTARPSLFLDFAKAPAFFDPRLSFSRASAAAYFDAAGVLKTVPANQPRCTWDPATGQSLGYLAEAGRTNLLTYSEDFTNAAWTKTNLTATGNSLAAPDGATTADTLAVTSGSGAVSQGITITAGNGIATSIFAKANASNFLWLQIGDGTNTVTAWFNLATGAVGTNTAGAGTCTYASAQIKALPNGWYRCTLIVTTATSTGFTAKFSAAAADNTAPANTNSIYAWGAQAESASATAQTSYIATAGSTVTRNADVMSIATDTSWFNALEGTLLVEGALTGAPQVLTQVMASFWDGTSSNSINLYRATGAVPLMRVLNGGVEQAQLSNSAGWPGTEAHKLVGAWKANDFAFASDGSSIRTDTAGSLPTVTTLRIGLRSNTTEIFMGTIARLIYWPRRISDADIVSLAA